MNNETEFSHEIRILKKHIQHAASELEQQDACRTAEGMGSLIYLGNHQDAIPRNLILDPHLESGEIHTWTLLKIHIVNPALPSTIPTQNDLMAILKCSRPVLSRHLQVLRALRWITLCAEVRGKDGQYRGNVYTQHDQPLSLQDTLYLDPGYLQFMEQPSSGPTLKRLRQIKEAVLRHMDYQMVSGVQLDKSPHHLKQVSAHLKGLHTIDALDTSLACPVGATLPHQVANLYTKVEIRETQDKPDIYLSHDTHADHSRDFDRDKTGRNGHVNKFYMDDRVNVYMDTCSSSSYIKTTTTYDHLNFPKAMGSERLRLYAVKILDVLENKQQQQFALDYLTDRIRAGEQGTDKAVGNPIGFLNWIVRNLQDGTLPESAYGVRDNKEKVPAKPEGIDDKTRRKREQEAWARSLKERGFELDTKTGLPIRRVNAASG